MAFKGKFYVASFIILLVFVSSCKKTPSESKPPSENNFPETLEIQSPNATETYWTDRSVPCAHNEPDYADKTEWLVGEGEDAEAVSCTDGKLDTELPEGEHTITARIAEDSDSVEASVTITVKAGFSVTLAQPKDGAEYFVGDMVSCSATVEPEKYEEHLEITVGERDCENGEAELTEAGETTVRAAVNLDGRTEADEASIEALPEVSGKLFPLTDQGIASAAGLEITMTLAAGEAKAKNTLSKSVGADGTFAFSDAPLDVYETESVTLAVTASGSFYGARADITGAELKEIVVADSLGFTLAPKQWTVRCGDFSGQSTTIKLPEALKRYDPDNSYSSFYMFAKVFGTNMYRSLRPKDRPLPTAFNRADSETAITAADSTAFWQETERIETKVICRGDLLAPATIAEVPTRRDGVQIRSKSAGTGAVGGASPDENGHIKGGGMGLPIDKFGDSYGQRHELAQILGFGEQSEWVGITSSNMSTSIPGGFSRYSVDDASHIQLYMDTVDLQFEKGISFGVYEWRRVFNIPSLPDN